MARRTRYRPTDGFIPLAFWPTADSAPVPVQASRFPFIHSAPVSVAFTADIQDASYGLAAGACGSAAPSAYAVPFGMLPLMLTVFVDTHAAAD